VTANGSPEAALQRIRADIDAIDRQIQDLLNRRAVCAQQVAEVKRADLTAAAGAMGALSFYRPEREASFRSCAELCVTRQIITAIKTAARNKHTPLNTYVSFSNTRAGSEQETTLADVLPDDPVTDPINQAISTEELQSLVDCLGKVLSPLESQVLAMYLEGRSYEEVAERLECNPKSVDNALQRVKRKVETHLKEREVLDLR
jgi:RNA polymerase sporulation-specific sigma factor